jgi:hypothetical protein
VATEVISRQSDLDPRLGGIPFRKLAGRSDACGEALLPPSLLRASTPAHDRPALHLRGTLATVGAGVAVGGVVTSRASRGRLRQQRRAGVECDGLR